MDGYLAQSAATPAAEGRAAMVLDGAGRRAAEDLRIPDDATLAWPLPHSPRLDPVGRTWLHLRERHPSHRLPDGCGAIADALCRAWHALTAERLRSLASQPCLERANV